MKYLALLATLGATHLFTFYLGSTRNPLPTKEATVAGPGRDEPPACPPPPELAELRPEPRGTAARRTPPACPKATLLGARLGRCEALLKASAQAQLEAQTPTVGPTEGENGAPSAQAPEAVPFPEGYPASEQQRDILGAIGSILGEDRIEALDCSEYPCIAYVEIAREPGLESGQRQAEALYQAILDHELGQGGITIALNSRDPGSGRAAIAVGTDAERPIRGLTSNITRRNLDYFDADEAEGAGRAAA